MKKQFLFLAFMLIGTFAFANEGLTVLENSNFTKEVNSNSLIEYKVVKNEFGIDACYIRFCWNVSETERRCTEWQQVPCETPLEVEGLANPTDPIGRPV